MTSPTVGVLQKLAKALDARASSFLDDGPARRRR
jgi:hypothetical protein